MLKTKNYRPEIDGLRAIAILPVMLFHAGLGPFSGGFIGVDIFFVISGFLITTIIFREVTEGKFSYLDFYERRARRILPALYFLLLISTIPAWFLLIPSDFVNFAKNIIGSVSFSSNITLWQQKDYFDQAAELKPLLHTWSLAVEEQFYLFFPILLIALHRYLKKHILLVIISILMVSLGLSHWGAHNKPSATYYLLPTRAWELLVGAVIAFPYTQNWLIETKYWLNKYANSMSNIGLLLTVIPMVTFNENTPFPSLWAVLPCTGAALLIIFSQPKTIAHTFLSNKFLVGIGLVSYSAYLWHQPVYAFMKHQSLWRVTDQLMLFSFALSLCFAYLSWAYIERPFRDKSKISTQGIWIFSAVGAVILIVIGIISTKYKGFENRFDLRPPLTQSTFDLPTRSNGWCFYSVDTDTSLKVGSNGFKCELGASNSTTKFLLIGDSYAGMYEPFWDAIAKQLSVSINSITTNWCHPSFTKKFWWSGTTPALEQCMLNRQFAADSIENYEVVVISAIWSTLEEKKLMNGVFEFINTITAERNRKVIIMAQPPVLIRSSVISSVYRNGKLVQSKYDSSAESINAKLNRIAESNRNVLFIDRESLFATRENSGLLLSKDNIPYSLDGGHISVYGSMEAAENYIQKKDFNDLKKFMD